MSRDFYIGWEERMPEGHARVVRRAVIGFAAVAVLVAALVAALQPGFAVSSFEFGVSRELVGWVQEKPYPTLLVPTPGQGPGGHRYSRYVLAESGSKFGAQSIVAGFDGQLVRLTGTLIYRGDQTMVDVEAGSLEKVDATRASPGGPEDLGVHTLAGEIVDSKCYYGVMNPATGKVHRACAARCISSGAPPALLVRDAAGGSLTLLLVDEQGRGVNDRVLELVAEPVEIRGRVTRHDNLLVLAADPAGYRRLD